ncbi:hypothetical protein KKF91_04730 [Myxococcota bacterium]|nr:hypothetical protein [Myxococcota bacterium]MBU1429853.1 hypothetical protein [Myxococcota bacterium]MBU1898149.1 hypothetical protein [Myxococcota bacterium]
MKIEINPRALALLASTLIMALLWSRPALLLAYLLLVLMGLLTRLLLLPRRAAAAERRLKRDALRLLSEGQHAALEALLARQWLIRRFGRRFVLLQLAAMAAEADGRLDEARRGFEAAIAQAPEAEAAALRMNITRLERAQGADASATRARSQATT